MLLGMLYRLQIYHIWNISPYGGPLAESWCLEDGPNDSASNKKGESCKVAWLRAQTSEDGTNGLAVTAQSGSIRLRSAQSASPGRHIVQRAYWWTILLFLLFDSPRPLICTLKKY